MTYQRPEGKSGGHGVGWSEIPRYKLRVPTGWEETPVSIADLGGTEVRLAECLRAFNLVDDCSRLNDLAITFCQVISGTMQHS